MLSYGCLKELPPVLDRSYVSCDLVQRGRHLDAVPTGLDRQDLVRCITRPVADLYWIVRVPYILESKKAVVLSSGTPPCAMPSPTPF